MTEGGAGPGAAPAEALALFGDRLGAAERYVARLAEDGVVRGLIGPREVTQLWLRHVVNCALLAELLEPGERVVDIGSGAGLPGVVLAVARPDVTVDLVEPLERRSTFLLETVSELELGDRVRVHRGRAEQQEIVAAVGGADVVTSRAVAPLDRLVGWSLPLARVRGRMLALKGARAESELVEAQSAITRAGGGPGSVVPVGSGENVTRVVIVEKVRDARVRRGRSTR